MCDEPFFLDICPTVSDPRQHMNFEATISCGTRHRQAMLHEIPVFRHDVDDSGLHNGPG
jgi:hypothetical protein